MKITGLKSVELSSEEATKLEAWETITLVSKDDQEIPVEPGRFCALILAPNGNGSYRISPERGAKMFATHCTKSDEEKKAVLEAAKKSPEKYRGMFIQELYNGKIQLTLSDLLECGFGKIQVEGLSYTPPRRSQKLADSDPLASMFY
jgi:hypothetical protein